jgi:hypothetical protein
MDTAFLMNVAGLFLGILGIILAVYFYVKSIRYKRLFYDARSFQLVSERIASISGFTFRYRDEDVRNLSFMRMVVWNSGNDVLHSSDITATDPLRLHFSKATTVLQAPVPFVSHPTNNVRATLDPKCRNEVMLSFEYLNPGQGFVLSALFSGTSDDVPCFHGTIKGADNPKAFTGPATGFRYLLSIVDNGAPLLMGVIGALAIELLLDNSSVGFRARIIGIGIALELVLIAIQIIVSRIRKSLFKRGELALDTAFEKGFTASEFAP